MEHREQTSRRDFRMYRNYPRSHPAYKGLSHHRMHKLHLLWMGPLFLMWKRG